MFLCLGVYTFVGHFLEHSFFGLMGENLTRRIRTRVLAAMLRQEVRGRGAKGAVGRETGEDGGEGDREGECFLSV